LVCILMAAPADSDSMRYKSANIEETPLSPLVLQQCESSHTRTHRRTCGRGSVLPINAPPFIGRALSVIFAKTRTQVDWSYGQLVSTSQSENISILSKGEGGSMLATLTATGQGRKSSRRPAPRKAAGAGDMPRGTECVLQTFAPRLPLGS
jgi:hypothetical protein